MSITYKNLKELEYFNFTEEDLAYRFVPLFPIYNDGWEMYIDTEKGFIPLNIVDRSDGFYIAKETVKDTDLKLTFFDLMYKRINYKENIIPLNHIYDDIYNLLASIEKINFFSEIYKREEHFRLSKYASVELEAIFQNSRAIFENLQLIQNNLMEMIISANDDDFFSINKIQYEKKFTFKEYIKKYKIPEVLAKFYVRVQEFFFFVLDMRNDIFHSRKSFKLFLGDEGFSISLKDYNLESLHFWDEHNTLKNDLGSVKALIAYITLNTINALEEYAMTISSIIQLPNDILPNYNIYVRSEFNETLKQLHTYVDDNAWNKNEAK